VSYIAGVVRALNVAGKFGATDWPFLDDYGVAAFDADIRGLGNHRGGWLHGLGALTVGAGPLVLGLPLEGPTRSLWPLLKHRPDDPQWPPGNDASNYNIFVVVADVT